LRRITSAPKTGFPSAEIFPLKVACCAKVNVDEELELAQQFGVQSIPTLILFKDGAPIDIMVGVQDKETLVGKITKAL